MDKLYYFPNQKILLLVKNNYERCDQNVIKLIEHLKKCSEDFSRIAKVPFDQINTKYISASLGKRVFYVKTNTIPQGTEVIDFRDYERMEDFICHCVLGMFS